MMNFPTINVQLYSACSFCRIWLISYGLSANEQYFSLTTNQPTVLSAMAYQSNKPKRTGRLPVNSNSEARSGSITYLKVITCFLPSNRNRTIVTEVRLNLLSLYKRKKMCTMTYQNLTQLELNSSLFETF